ncbi:MAG: FAD-binding oxidoreductase, partial [Rhizobiales bacterium]|nr:FAD-binding oxidoreductase [Hyphomicrobiales bacterium]
MHRSTLDLMTEEFGEAVVLADLGTLERYLRDWSGDHRGEVLAVVRPASVADVQRTVRFCRQYGLSVIPQGGNTGLVAGAAGRAPDRAVIVNLERLNRIRGIDAENLSLRADAGCTLQQIKDASEALDCQFPLALGAQGSCQVGGNAATNAGGVNVLRYGMTRDLVLGLEVVLPDGEFWNGFSALRKDNRGYDLKQLFIGSEGTLGIITGVEVKLFPRVKEVETAYVGVRSFTEAMALFRRGRSACADLMTAFEVIGAECMPFAQMIKPDLRIPIDAPVHILMEASSSGRLGLRQFVVDFLAEASEDNLVVDAVVAETIAQARSFWAIREGLVEGQGRQGFHVRTDLSVRLSDVAALIEKGRLLVASRYPGWTSLAYGHAGDGNVHFNVVPPST